MPKVSVLLPTHNGSRFLKRAVQSVIGQSFSDWELLILDDGSIDETAAITHQLVSSDPRIFYLPSEENLGIQKTLNRGLKEAKGELIARIDDDDEWCDPEKLASQFKHLVSNPNCVLIGTAAITVDESGHELFRSVPPEGDAEIRKVLLKRNCFTHSSVLFRKDVALEVGGYGESESVRHVEDYDLWFRLGRRGALANLPTHSVKFTLRPGNISSRNKLAQFRRDIGLVWRYGKEQPGFLSGLAFSIFRFVTFWFYRLLPLGMQKNLLARYKNI